MDPSLIIAGMQFAAKLMEAYPAIHAAATTQDQAELNAAYEKFKAASNDAADRVRAIPEDPI